MKKISLHAQIFLIDNFLSKVECLEYIDKGELASFERAKVKVDNKELMIKGIRNNERLLFKDEYLAKQIWSKIAPFVNKDIEDYFPIGVNELFRIYKYSVGERFKMHRDGSFQRNNQEKSFYSLLIYLNDDFEGGQTAFKNGITVEPKTGQALVFHHPIKHEGKILTEGNKYVLRTDIMFKKEN